MSTSPPTVAELKTRFPEFASIDDPIIQANLDASLRLLDATSWGDLFFDAVSFDVAHSVALMNYASSMGPTGGISAGAGQVTSSSAAGMSASFSAMNVSDKNKSEFWYSKTMYGQMFLRLRSTLSLAELAS